MPSRNAVGSDLADLLIQQVEQQCLDAERRSRPLEVDPYRDRLFQLFVTAHGAGFIDEDAEVDLTADGLCRALGARWGLADATRQSVEMQQRLPPQHLSKMRMLWAVMRMWMEWTYAWKRWAEFHGTSAPASE